MNGRQRSSLTGRVHGARDRSPTASIRAGRIFFLGVVEQLYRMRDRGILAAWRKLNRMRDCVALMIFKKKVVTVLLPLASVLLLVAARKDL